MSILMPCRVVASLLLASAVAIGQGSKPAGPPDGEKAKAALDASPRHGEYVDVSVEADKPPVRCWVVYPEVKDKAPVVIVIQEIFGLSDWLRATTDRLAADGYIAIAPDLVSGMGPGGGGTDSFAGRDDVVKATRGLTPEYTNAVLDKVAAYGRSLPATNGKTATVGFCWGGAASFAYAAHSKDLAAAVVAYGTPPKAEAEYAKINAPVLGLYGGHDARVTATVPEATAKMKAAGKTYDPHVYDNAGHGFFRQQTGKNGANQTAADQGWTTLIAFLNKHTQ